MTTEDDPDRHTRRVDMPPLTQVSVYLGDCRGKSLPLVCEGTAAPFGTTWERAQALQHPYPRGPYPVSRTFMIFAHETSRTTAACLQCSAWMSCARTARRMHLSQAPRRGQTSRLYPL